MRVAILSAMPEEITPIINEFSSHKIKEYANNKYHLSKYNGHELIIAYSKIGKVLSAFTATIMIEHFGAEMLLFSGVAGGLSNNISLGDIVIASQTVQYDIDITAFGYKQGEIPGNSVFIHTCKNLRNKFKHIADNNYFTLKEGIIATGDKFVNNRKLKETISNKFGAIAVEMEGASVHTVCNELKIPCALIRAISDVSDEQAAETFPNFLEFSAKRSAKLISLFIQSL